MAPDLTAIEEAYQTRWPMKEGKQRGFKKLKSTLKSEADVGAFISAMDAYIAMKTKAKTELQFWLRWHTFCNNWTDYLDPSITQGKALSGNAAQLERIMKGEL